MQKQLASEIDIMLNPNFSLLFYSPKSLIVFFDCLLIRNNMCFELKDTFILIIDVGVFMCEAP